MGILPLAFVCEDEPLLQLDIVEHLQGSGWIVLDVANGEDALRLLPHLKKIDLLLTDIALGGKESGWDVADAVHLEHPSCVIIYASGNEIDAARQLPGSMFFKKPYAPAELAKVCRVEKR